MMTSIGTVTVEFRKIPPFGNYTAGDPLMLAKVITHASVQYFFMYQIFLHATEIVFMFEKYFVRYLNGGLALLTTRLSLLSAATFPKIFSSSAVSHIVICPSE